jgi:hypothetical protein
MAYLVPSDVPHSVLQEARAPELETLAVFRSKLSPELTVYHGVHWTNEHRKFVVFGEIDFVVVSPSGQLLVIEQKNGQLEETAGGLVKHYRGQSKNVDSQIARSIHNLRTKFSRLHRGVGLDIDYLIYCPEHRLRNVNASSMDASRIVDANAKADLIKRVEDLILGAEEVDEEHLGLIHGFLEQSFQIVPDIHARQSAQERVFTRHSEGLAEVIENIEMKPRRIRVKGTAGCGKSLVALRTYQGALLSGKRPLLVCMNRPLAEKLRAAAGQNGYVDTFHGLCHRFLESKGKSPNFEEVQTDPAFWDRLPERVLGENVTDDWRFETLIVDEGQDFRADWWEILRLFVHEDADVVWLEDDSQNIMLNASVPLDGFIGYVERKNYRTPKDIAEFIWQAVDVEFDCANQVPGFGVGVHAYEDATTQPKLIAGILKNLMGQSFSLEDVAIVSLKHRGESSLGTREKAGQFTLRRYTGEYDLFGNQLYTTGQVLFDSIYRFKGQGRPLF